jgi:para-aminobenzoate synthetase/4-amino-4-deoxychorismate lyase
MVFDGAYWLSACRLNCSSACAATALLSNRMKGTRLGAGMIPPSRYGAELAGSVKDKAENLMSSTSATIRPAWCAAACRWRVLFAVESYPTVHQGVVSTVHARLQPGKGAADLVRRDLPRGSITGAPKSVMELIDQTERDARPYCNWPDDADGDGLTTAPSG